MSFDFLRKFRCHEAGDCIPGSTYAGEGSMIVYSGAESPAAYWPLSLHPYRLLSVTACCGRNAHPPSDSGGW